MDAQSRRNGREAHHKLEMQNSALRALENKDSLPASR